MSNEVTIYDDAVITDVSKHILELRDSSKESAHRAVNHEIVVLYYRVGEYLDSFLKSHGYGDKCIPVISQKIMEADPSVKGFEKRSLYRMRQFYLTYPDFKIVSTLLTQLSWSCNLMIMHRSKTESERLFYIDLAIREHYSVRELSRQMDSAYYQRAMLSEEKLKPSNVPQKVKEKFLDTYVLDFLDLPQHYEEDDLQSAIVSNLRDFILEFGKDFAFMGQEYRISVGNHDYYLDLLFFHRGLCCLVNVELKIGEFKPEYMGKMQFYLEALDRDVRKPHENPSVGIILCAGKDDEVVEYAMSQSMSSTLVAEYQLTLPDKALLESKLREYTQLIDRRDSDEA